jgi:hypothetical protein
MNLLIICAATIALAVFLLWHSGLRRWPSGVVLAVMLYSSTGLIQHALVERARSADSKFYRPSSAIQPFVLLDAIRQLPPGSNRDQALEQWTREFPGLAQQECQTRGEQELRPRKHKGVLAAL